MTRYIIYTRLIGVEWRTDKKWIGGIGEGAKFRDIPLGYFLHLDGSHECIHVGFEEPSLQPGDTIKITIERALR